MTGPGSSVDLGTSARFVAVATGGAGGPYNVSWSFGDGARAYGPQVSHAFPTAGTYHPTVQVRDRLGAGAVQNLSAVTSAVPPASPGKTLSTWLPLIAGTIALVLGTLGALQLYRRAEAAPYLGSLQWVPQTGPNRTLKGLRVCRNCGTPNNAAREGCSACGAPLGSSIFG